MTAGRGPSGRGEAAAAALRGNRGDAGTAAPGAASRDAARRAARRHATALLLLAAVLAPFYGPLLGRNFTSEDFLLLRLLEERPPWRDLRGLLAGPWLGIDVVRFYRPVSWLMLGVEERLFGGAVVAYNLVHHGVHVLNAWLVYRLAACLGPATDAASRPAAAALPALAAALLFALHPLHPNAVAWVASYATLFAAAFVLTVAVAWERWRRRGRLPGAAAVVLLHLLALGSYEAAVVLPAALLLRELVMPAGAAVSARRRAVLLAVLAAASGFYLLLRRALFGQAVGGYESFAERFGDLPTLAADAVLCLYRLLDPRYPAPLAPWVPWAVLAAVVLPLLLLRLAGGGAAHLRAWLLGWGWALLFLAPFAFKPFVPGDGRFAYLASAGVALAVGRLAAAAVTSRAERQVRTAAVRLVTVALPVVLLVHWGLLLVDNARVYRHAGHTAHAMAESLEALAAAGPRRVFAAGYPRFLYDDAGTPLAQVMHYGLADSVRPPFRTTSLAVYPLADVHGAAVLRPLHPGALFVAWDGERFRPLPAGQALAELRVELGGDGEPRLHPLPGPGRRYRVVAVGQGNADVTGLGVLAGPRPVPVAPSAAFLRTMDRLYGTPSWWWVEALDAAGSPVAASRPMTWDG